jgi:hypothetical protein
VSSPKRWRLKRAARLEHAKTKWASGWPDSTPAKISQYAKWFKIDRLCAVLDLQQLGHDIDPEYVESLRTLRQQPTPAKTDQPFRGTDQDEYLAYIAGYTSAGFPYGISWEESETEIDENEILESGALKVNLPDPLRQAIEMRAIIDQQTVEQTVLRLLALGLEAAAKEADTGHRIELPIFAGKSSDCQLTPGQLAELLDEMDFNTLPF